MLRDEKYTSSIYDAALWIRSVWPVRPRLPTQPEYTWLIILILALIHVRNREIFIIIYFDIYCTSVGLFCGVHILAGKILQMRFNAVQHSWGQDISEML